MKEIEQYLCAGCWMDMISAGLKCVEVKREDRERHPCDWCGRKCYGATYRISYKGRDET